jgi:thiaminase (transcriptional activator TenA)
MSGNPTYGNAFALWRKANTTPWQAYTRHGFVQGLGDGTLPKSAYLHYLKQDYIFLIHFARAWGLAVAKADTLDEMKACAAILNTLVNDEMQLHVQTCAQFGISEEQLSNTAEETENLAYTRYVLDAGYSGDFLDLLAALAPCVLGYGEIGAWLADKKTSPIYDDWIAAYAGKDYQHACAEVGRLIDHAILSRLGTDYTSTPRWAKLTERFETATRLEIGFWDMGLRGT